MSQDFSNLAVVSYTTGQQVLSKRSEKQRKANGQFLTPPAVARFMAQQLGTMDNGSRLLDPAVGSGVLICAVIDRLIAEGGPAEIWIDGYEIDAELVQIARETLQRAVEQAALRGITVHVHLHECDFIPASLSALQPSLFDHLDAQSSKYHRIVANPPYFKLSQDDPRVKAARGVINGHTNIYTMFMALAVRLLRVEGRACFIVPRSFCSGVYFAHFRRDLLTKVTPVRVHLFDSRQDTFRQDDVLQENIILTVQHNAQNEAQSTQTKSLKISASQNLADLSRLQERDIPMAHFVRRRGETVFFGLPVTELDEQIIDIVDCWSGSLSKYNLEVSTGPVVPFRASSFLLDTEQEDAVPLLWMQNIRKQHVEWPIVHWTGKSKPQWFISSEGSTRLLVPNSNYVLVRRFSAKEETRRLIAAPLLSDRFNDEKIGLENHLNYIHRKDGLLDIEEATGLSALYNSALLDRYFRITNGNTQVNAAELRSLPLPPRETICAIGQRISLAHRRGNPFDLDALVMDALREHRLLPLDFPSPLETQTVWAR